ncbi:MAG TPA: A/G-specific adenine glycosylase [Armatimonadota bacterium]|nr:A/G-specific adenine glycosylase [Armatimonadota bacterium]
MTPTETWEPDERDAIRQALQSWFGQTRRSLPWRDKRTPYRTWISEIMLQQTQVEAVRPFFERFMTRFPTLQDLADAPEADVLQQWAGLGYYSRARNLHRAARVVVDQHGGDLPPSVEELIHLPGIGRYTAGAIASLAYNLPAPILDGNVMRALARLLALRGDPRSGKTNAALWAAAEELAVGPDPGVLNEAVMELGALVCLPRTPRCSQCPVSPWCRARREGIETELPERRPDPRPETRSHAALVARQGDRVLLQHRVSSTIWRGLFAFPTDFPHPSPLIEHNEKDGARRTAIALAQALGLPDDLYPIGTIRHGVMNWRITLHAFGVTPDDATAASLTDRDGLRWVPLEELARYGMPSPHRRIARTLSNKDERDERR